MHPGGMLPEEKPLHRALVHPCMLYAVVGSAHVGEQPVHDVVIACIGARVVRA